MSRFSLVPDHKNGHGILVNPVSDDISAITELDKPFPKLFGQIINHSAKMGICTEDLHTLTDSLTSSAGRIRVLRAQEVAEPLQVPDGCGGKSYLWHAGAGSSLSVPQLSSQRSTSSAVA